MTRFRNRSVVNFAQIFVYNSWNNCRVPASVIEGQRRECEMHGKQIKFQSESVMADVRLGITVAGLYTLVGMGLIIVFM